MKQYLTFLLRLTDSKYASLFLYQANYIQYAEFDNPSSYYHEGFLEVDRTFSNGLGIGVEIVALKHLSINLMTGYHLDNVLNENNEYETSFGLKGEIGLFYKF